jgi:ribonuclease HI
MPKKKFYAVQNGRQPGVFETWDAAKAQVFKFSGAIYKSFTTRSAAEAFLVASPMQAQKAMDWTADESVYYVDGSCQYDRRTGAAFVHTLGGLSVASETKRSLGKGTNQTAELGAIQLVLEHVAGQRADAAPKKAKINELAATSMSKPRVHIVTDSRYCHGILTTGWTVRANRLLVESIKTQMDDLQSSFSLSIHWCKAHAGCVYNERADALAKEAAQEDAPSLAMGCKKCKRKVCA